MYTDVPVGMPGSACVWGGTMGFNRKILQTEKFQTRDPHDWTGFTLPLAFQSLGMSRVVKCKVKVLVIFFFSYLPISKC